MSNLDRALLTNKAVKFEAIQKMEDLLHQHSRQMLEHSNRETAVKVSENPNLSPRKPCVIKAPSGLLFGKESFQKEHPKQAAATLVCKLDKAGTESGVQRGRMGALSRDDSEQCSTIASLLALSLGKATHLVYSSQSFGRVGRCWELLTEWVSGARDIRGTSIVRTLLVLCFSAFALLLSLTSLSLGQAISARINEVIRSSSGSAAAKASEKELEELPEPVKRYLRYSLENGASAITFCSLKQNGVFRLRASQGMKASEGWKKVSATQHFSVSNPGYVWVATIQLAPFFWIRGWDSYVNGSGHMFWKLLSTFTLVNFGGPEIDRAALSRYLSETVFFPTALIPSHCLSWEPVSADSAKAILTHKGLSVSAIFHFNEMGQITHSTSSDRPRRLDDGTSSEDCWTGYYRDYGLSDGVNVPRTMEAVWNLLGGDFKYAKLEITENKRWHDLEAKQYLLH